MPPRKGPRRPSAYEKQSSARARAKKAQRHQKIFPGVRGGGNRTERTLDAYKNMITSMFIDGKRVPEIRQCLNEMAPLPVAASMIRERLERWGLQKRTKRKGVRSSIRLSMNGLEAYKIQLLTWSQDGHTLSEIHRMFQDQFGQNPSSKLLKKTLDRWQEPISDWRGVHQDASHSRPAVPPLPMNILSKKEQALLREGIRESYLRSQDLSSNQGNSSYDQFVPQRDSAMMDDDMAQIYVENEFQDWSHRLVNALCYDTTEQQLVLNECLQPGCHWSNDRLLDPLWVCGIRLPGSYANQNVDTEDKIMNIVNSITPEILRGVYTILKGIVEKIAKSEEFAGLYLETLQFHPPTTTPAKCVIDLLRVLRFQLSEVQSEVSFMKSLKGLDMNDIPKAKPLLQLLKEKPLRLSLLEQMTGQIIGKLQLWSQPWMKLEELPGLSASDMGASEGASGEHQAYWDDLDSELHEDESDNGSGSESEKEEDGGNKNDNGDGDGKKKGGKQQAEATIYTLFRRMILKKIRAPEVFNDWRAPTTGVPFWEPPLQDSAQCPGRWNHSLLPSRL